MENAFDQLVRLRVDSSQRTRLHRLGDHLRQRLDRALKAPALPGNRNNGKTASMGDKGHTALLECRWRSAEKES
jgi:hypothetical protein